MHNWFGILLSLLIALFLTLIPMPDWTIWLRPVWILMVLIYWAMMTPNEVGIGFAWFVGLFVDLVQGTLLGEHALAYMVVIYFVSRMYIRLRMSPLLQQGLSVWMFVLIYQSIIFCTQGFIGALPSNHLYWAASVTSMLVWPWLFVLLRDYGRWLKIA